MLRLVRPKLAVNDEGTVAPGGSEVAVSITDLLSKLTYIYSPLIVQFLATTYSAPPPTVQPDIASLPEPEKHGTLAQLKPTGTKIPVTAALKTYAPLRSTSP
jgi:hypothetical protein